ncbi:MAG: ABC transporter ATP-binding protein [Betaproteobacteria bacterium]|nr:ABC transporter ATP-binding protein [Betaproteobacteria bacterium]MBI3935567.1 ABC transporter ATP-binding protein [Betaproteobacteria bacterium]
MSSLTVAGLSKAFGDARAVADLDLKVGEGEMLVLVGPSGCGKTTTLRCIAGLERPTAGRITIGNRVVTEIDQGVFVPPEKREIGMVFQSYAVWPHMTVYDNVAYPLKAIGVLRGEIHDRVMKTLRLVQLETLADRYSSQISGGQQQRVALARSLVAEPKLLLFDEPLSNLDANLRLQMRVEIKELQKRLGFTSVYVTHDQTEAMAIADRIAVMDRGMVRQVGSPRAIYDRPANTFVAGFMGTTNLLEGSVQEVTDAEAVVRTSGGITLRAIGARGAARGATVHVSIRPEALQLCPLEKPAAAANVWPATVALSTFLGDSVLYRLEVAGHTFEVHGPSTEVFEVGSKVTLAVEPSRCTLLIE